MSDDKTVADAIARDLWRTIQDELRSFAAALPPAATDWRWRAEQWSIADQLAHIVEVRDWWLGHIALGDPDRGALVEERDGAPPVRDLAGDPETLVGELERTDLLVGRSLALPAAELERIASFEGRGGRRQRPLSWVIPHTLEHDSHHQGQATLLLRMWRAMSGDDGDGLVERRRLTAP